MKEKLCAALLFAGFFGLYVYTAAPQVAPYRDSGEMVVLSGTLGVAHPPGYALYTLVANAWRSMMPGNMAYRANVLSGLCAALAVALFFLLMRVWLGILPSILSALALGLSTVFWELALVSEMYALGALMIVLVLLALFKYKSAPLAVFLFALALAVRMDLLLFAPLVAYWVWAEKKWTEWPNMALYGALGMSVFAYMMVRSLHNPILDWGNPDNFSALFRSLSRKSYASTLDLLSLNYKPGENFAANLRLYGLHLVNGLGLPGAVLALIGAFGVWRIDKKTAFFFVAGFVISGPLFLYMANMPPNPHAVAIIEASYLLPDIFAVVFVGFGLLTLSVRSWRRIAGMAALAIGLLLAVPSAYKRVNKRNNFYVRDYVTNVFRSAPMNSVVASNKDVQVFSLWAAQLVEGKRRDVSVVPVGLSASPWYWEMRRRWPVKASPEVSLKDASGWNTTTQQTGDRPFLAGLDVEGVPPSAVPHGLLLSLKPINDEPYLLPEFCVYRGVYRYGQTPDFFSTDLIGDHSRAHHRQGLSAMAANRLPEANWFLARAGVLDPTYPRPFTDRGYLAYTQKQYPLARAFQTHAVRLYNRLVEQAEEFNTLPDVKRYVKMDLSSAYLNLGASCEHMGDREEALKNYFAAAETAPNAQAHYNIAVLYWGADWPRVISNLEACLKIDPQYADAAKFLVVARTKGKPS